MEGRAEHECFMNEWNELGPSPTCRLVKHTHGASAPLRRAGDSMGRHSKSRALAYSPAWRLPRGVSGTQQGQGACGRPLGTL